MDSEKNSTDRKKGFDINVGTNEQQAQQQAQQQAYFDSIIQTAKADGLVSITEGAGFGFSSLGRTVTACESKGRKNE